MLKKKLKELHMINSSREGESNVNITNNHQQIKKVQLISNEHHFDNFSKRNLPELKLTKFKSRVASEADIESKEDNKKTIKKQKSRSLLKKNDIVFPQIGKNKLNDIVITTHKQGKYSNNTRINNNIATIHKLKPSLPINKQHNVKANKPKVISKLDNALQSYHPFEPSSIIKTNDIDMKEKELTEKIKMLQSLFNSISSTLNGINSSPLDDLFHHKSVDIITSELLSKDYQNFSNSTISKEDEFSSDDIIKAYAYNSSQGNIRSYNEDTITATKVNEQFSFFAVYDGHGGNGCSLYLKDNLHSFIKEFSIEGLRNAITEAENDFIKNKATTSEGEKGDTSGSCGCMLMIHNNRCIIANVGDSRCVIIKNEKVDFTTTDHKPNTEEERERITKAGGRIYQTARLFPLYQNGKEIDIPWRVSPGGLSVSRTFGDIEAKEEKYGGMKNVVVALPDITEYELSEDINFIVLGCDGIFDVLSNEDLIECSKIAIREKKNKKVNELCGEIVGNIIKASLAKDSFDNVSCVVIAINLNIVHI